MKINLSSRPLMTVAATISLITSLNIAARPATASVYALGDDNSTAAFDPDFSENPSNNGILFWTVDKVNQLFHDSFWYRTGSTSGETSINALDLVKIQQAQPADNKISALYAGKDFEIGLDFKLDGGREGHGVSNLFEDISVTNTGSEPLDFHLFNYTDFDLTNSGEQDTTEIGSQKATQQNGVTFTTNVVEPAANYYQTSTFPTLVNALEDDTPTTLENLSGPLTGDTDYAFQWDFVLDPKALFSINNTKSIASHTTPETEPTAVPEPTTTFGFITFIFLMFLHKRNQSRKTA
jgi:hypothetical protein